GMETLVKQGYDVFVEIGPKPTLLGLVRNCFPEAEGLWLPSLRQRQEDWGQMLMSLGTLYVHGVAVDWSGFDRDYPRRRVVLPTYPFQRQQYWIKTAEPERFGAVALSPKEAQNQILQPLQDESHSTPTTGRSVGSERLVKYYQSLSTKASRLTSVDGMSEPPSDYLRFAPFPERVKGFSWLLTFSEKEQHREHFELVMKAQREMKRVLFRGVDLSALTRVLDIGCGYASDLIELGQQYPHLSLDGCNISPEQIEIGNERVGAFGLQSRIKLYQLDSSTDEFPSQYDLAIGFQVIHHIKDKAGVFSNVGRHLKNGGLLILAEIVSNLTEGIDHSESSADFSPKAEWVELLARNHFRVVECVDASREIGNFLFDPHFEENFSRVTKDADEVTKAHLLGPHLLGELLKKELALYCLLTVQKDNYLPEDAIRRVNREKLDAPVPYSQIIGRGFGSETPPLSHRAREDSRTLTREELLTSEPAQRQRLLEDYLSEQVARTLGLTAAQLDLQQPLNNMGLDSLMALELKKGLEVEFQVDVPVVKFIEGVSVTSLTKLLLCQMAEAEEPPEASPATASPPSQGEQKASQINPSKAVQPEEAGQILEKLDELTDEGVDALLNAMLSEEGDGS
ncbi:methyltransferase, partial [Candidatus Poribacteria bacterium]|nr:methyltransferase [Candidatus Poribacteria bacterium]